MIFRTGLLLVLWTLAAGGVPTPAEANAPPEYLQLYRQGRQLEQSGKLDAAVAHYRQAIDTARAGYPENAAKILHWLGGVEQRRQAFAAAQSAFEEALQLREQVLGKDHDAVAVSLDALAGLHAEMGRYAEAEALYRRALKIEQTRHGTEHWKVALRLNNLAEVYRLRADYVRAEELLRQALAIDTAVWGEKHANVAIRLGNLAEVYRQQGAYDQAKPLQEQALALDEANYRAGEIDALNLGIRYNNLGQLYRTLGDYAEARPYYAKALELWREDPGEDTPVYAVGLNNLGWLDYLARDYAGAAKLYRQSLEIASRVYGDAHPDVARNLNNLGLLYAAQKNTAKAEEAYRHALSIWNKVHGATHPATITTANNLAKLYRDHERLEEAERVLKGLVVEARRNGQASVLWLVYDNLTRVFAAGGQSSAAVLLGKQAVNQLQSLRLNLAALDKELQQSFLADKHETYQFVANLLVDQGRVAEAQEVLLMLKEEEYFDFVRRQRSGDSRTLRASYTRGEQHWIERARQLDELLHATPSSTDGDGTLRREADEKNALAAFTKYFEDLKQAFSESRIEAVGRHAAVSGDTKLAALAREYQNLREQSELSAAQQARKTELRKTMLIAARDFNACLAEIRTLEAFQEKNLDTLRALQGTLRELGHGVVLLHYLILPQRVRIILTTPDVQLCRETQVSASELDEYITRFRGNLLNRLKYPVEEMQHLYKLLLQPVAEDLRQARARTLMLALDGRLRYVPMAALHDGEKYIAENYAIALFTEAARDKLKDPPQADWKVAGLGLTEAVTGFDALPSVASELDGIVRDSPQDKRGIMPGLIKLNREFTADSLLDVLDLRWPVLHIASHFMFQPNTEADSYLLLGDGNPLTLAQIRLGYDFNGIELLTLSACQTAVGSTGRGGEVEGFGALAQKMGAKSVLATLWPVDDRSTGLFMQHLYREQQRGLTKAEALQAAQCAFINARCPRQNSDEAPNYPFQYDHPFYWAPFILMGNWL